VSIFLLLLTTSMRVVSGRFRSMRVGFPTGTRRCRSSEKAHSLLRWRVCLSWEMNAFTKTLIIFWSIFCASSFINSNTWHLICNNSNLNFIYGIVCLYVCVYAFSLYRESLDMILGDNPLISEVVLSQSSLMVCDHTNNVFLKGHSRQCCWWAEGLRSFTRTTTLTPPAVPMVGFGHGNVNLFMF
jgi:hypothetical protein